MNRLVVVSVLFGVFRLHCMEPVDQLILDRYLADKSSSEVTIKLWVVDKEWVYVNVDIIDPLKSNDPLVQMVYEMLQKNTRTYHTVIKKIFADLPFSMKDKEIHAVSRFRLPQAKRKQD